MTDAAKVIEQDVSTQIAEFRPFEQQLAEFRAHYDGVVYDLTDPKVEKQARSDRYAIGKVISKLDDTHKAVKAPLKAQIDLIDGERKRIKDLLTGVQDGIKSQITEHEAKIQAHQDALAERVEAIRAFAVFNSVPNSILIRSRIEQAGEVVIDESFEHVESQAALAKLKTIEALTQLLTDTLAQEQAEAEAKRQQEEQARIAAEEAAKAQQEREERIAREAAETARLAAEEKARNDAIAAEAAIERQRQATLAAEQAAAEAAERAEQEARDARAREEQAAIKAKRDAAEAARLATEAAEKAQRDKEAAERAEREKREADQAHTNAVNDALAGSFAILGEISVSAAKKIVLAIAGGDFHNVKIHY